MLRNSGLAGAAVSPGAVHGPTKNAPPPRRLYLSNRICPRDPSLEAFGRDGPGASGHVALGRRPRPFTQAGPPHRSAAAKPGSTWPIGQPVPDFADAQSGLRLLPPVDTPPISLNTLKNRLATNFAPTQSSYHFHISVKFPHQCEVPAPRNDGRRSNSAGISIQAAMELISNRKFAITGGNHGFQWICPERVFETRSRIGRCGRRRRRRRGMGREGPVSQA